MADHKPYPRRAVFAAKQIAAGGDVHPSAFIEAVSIAREHEREKYIEIAVDKLCALQGDKLVDACDQIVRMWFDDLPACSDCADPPEDAPAKDPDAQATAPGPGFDSVAMRGGEDRRPVSDLLTAGTVLVAATLRCPILGTWAADAAKRIRRNIVFPLHRGGHAAEASEIDRVVVDLQRAGKAAGTAATTAEATTSAVALSLIKGVGAAGAADERTLEQIRVADHSYTRLREEGVEPTASRLQFINDHLSRWRSKEQK